MACVDRRATAVDLGNFLNRWGVIPHKTLPSGEALAANQAYYEIPRKGGSILVTRIASGQFALRICEGGCDC